MRFLKIFAVAAVISFGVFACSRDNSRRGGIIIADSKSYEASIFRQNCAVCHGAEASGKIVNGAQVPSLRIGDAAAKNEEELYQQIAHGKLPMPGFENQLTEKEMRMMVKFIMHDLQGRDGDDQKQK
ncbi:MAG: cytochrome c [Pyrinomonadaceae bacterium]